MSKTTYQKKNNKIVDYPKCLHCGGFCFCDDYVIEVSHPGLHGLVTQSRRAGEEDQEISIDNIIKSISWVPISKNEANKIMQQQYRELIKMAENKGKEILALENLTSFSSYILLENNDYDKIKEFLNITNLYVLRISCEICGISSHSHLKIPRLPCKVCNTKGYLL